MIYCESRRPAIAGIFYSKRNCPGLFQDATAEELNRPETETGLLNRAMRALRFMTTLFEDNANLHRPLLLMRLRSLPATAPLIRT